METETVSINTYPNRDAHAEMQAAEAYVFGIWAAHKTIDDDRSNLQDYEWSITHLPTGALAYVADDKETVIEAARRLDSLDQPTIAVLERGEEMPRIKPFSLAWIRKVGKALKGLDVMAVSGPELVEPRKLATHLAQRGWAAA